MYSSSKWSPWIRAGLLALAIFLVWDCTCIYASQTSDAEKYAAIQKEYEGYHKKVFPEVSDLSVEKLLERKKEEKIILVDLRSPKEYGVSMIPGAITAEEFEANREWYKDHKIVTYCTIGYRSGLYAKKLRRENVEAFNLAGGLLAWAHAGKTFTCTTGETRKVHVYGENWNLLPETYQPD